MMVAPTARGGKLHRNARKHGKAGGRSLLQKPAAENRQLFGRDAFIEANAHAETRADVNNATQKVEFLAIVIELHANFRAGGSRVQRVDIAASEAHVAGAGGQPRSGLYFGDFDGKNQGNALRVPTIIHVALHSNLPAA